MFPPPRIVCLTEETVETRYLLGEQDRIVGISGYVVRPSQARHEKAPHKRLHFGKCRQQPQLSRISFPLSIVNQAPSLRDRRAVWLPPAQGLGDHCAQCGRRCRLLTER
jgi:hypothetical protein